MHRTSWVDERIGNSNPALSDQALQPVRAVLKKAVNSWAFTVATTSLIFVNSVLMGMETEFGDDGVGWVLMEAIFLAFYSIELCMRFGAEGLRACMRDRWIRFDAAIVVLAYFDICFMEPLSGQTQARTMALVLRTLRLVKLARIIRLLRFFRELWLLVSSFISAFKTLSWTFLLLLMVIYIFGIVFVKLLGKETDEAELRELFGTLPGAMFTLFQITTLEGWPDIARKVWETDQWYMTIVMLLFMMVSTFAIMNTVLAVIVEHTLTEAIEQRADMVQKAQAQLHHVVDILANIYQKSDSNRDGILTKPEFVKGLSDPKLRKLLHGMELGEDFACLDDEELGILFDTIDVDDSGELTPQEFVKGLVQMRGSAKARGLFELRCDMLKATRKQQTSLLEVQEQVRLQYQEIVQLDSKRAADFSNLASRLDLICAKLNVPRPG